MESICLRSGRPPAQDDDDMNVDLPSEDPIDNIGNIPLADGKGKINLFRLMCTFAVIESKVYKQLYSTKASKQSDGALLNTIGELDKELEEWKDAIPLDIRPEHEIKAAHPPLILHIVVLHFAYYNVLMTIHRMSIHHGLILYFPVSSLVTLFANILQNPQDPRARSDLRLMNQVVNFLSLIAVTEEQGGIKRMLGVCVEFERIAKVVLDKAEKESHSRRKRKSNREAEESGTAFQGTSPQFTTPITPISQNQQYSSQSFTPPTFTGETNHQAFNPNFNGFSPVTSNGSMSIPLDFAGLLSPSSTQPVIFENDLQHSEGSSSLSMGSFQQPFVPQDLWQMPQTLEWDWADINNMGFPAFDGETQPSSNGYNGV
ncbi:MAG: hypothetical protein Q9170_001484 [Blastenia crenularia]